MCSGNADGSTSDAKDDHAVEPQPQHACPAAALAGRRGRCSIWHLAAGYDKSGKHATIVIGDLLLVGCRLCEAAPTM